MTNEYRVFGPPGTGKTTYLTRQIQHAAAKYGTESILVASFTKTAATEITDRAGMKRHPNAGTLHALCYRALDRPTIAETRVGLWNDWLKDQGLSAQFRLSSQAIDEEAGGTDPTEGQTTGDRLLGEVQGLRARRADRRAWPHQPSVFASYWDRFKEETGMVDFTDLIELGLEEVGEPPAGAQVGFFDEVQDFTALELALVRRWAEGLEFVVLAGDDDQCIFSFKGATPEAFLSPEIPEDHKRILEQSYRVPRAVHELADNWIRRVQNRQPKDYKPKDAEGSVDSIAATWKEPELMIRQVEEAVDRGESVMILASCGYMLKPTVRGLRARGIPFWNPYRTKRGDWNPIRTGGEATSAADRILAYLRPDPDTWGDQARLWNYQELGQIIDPLQAKGNLIRGGKKLAKQLAEEREVAQIDDADVEAILDPETGLPWFVSLDLDRYVREVIPSKRKPYLFPAAVAKKYGAAKLQEQPQIIVGTVHSVKGGEADNVFLFPDLSPGGYRQWADARTRDTIRRVFYVAFTRSQQRLVLCDRAAMTAVDWGA